MRQTWILPASLAALLLVAPACDRRPKGVLSDDSMVDLMVDLKLAETYAIQHPGDPADSLSTRLAASVLASHGVSRADFDSTVAWYGRHFDDYVKLSERMEKRLSQRQKDFLANDVVSVSEGDNLWPYPQRITVSQAGASDGFSFSVDATEVKPGETLKWKMTLREGGAGKFLLGVEYADGTADYVSRTGGASGAVQFFLPVDSVLQPKRVYGVYHVPAHYLPVMIDSISLTHSPAGKDGQEWTATPVRYVRPKKYDPVKARMKMKADSLVNAADTARKEEPADETDGILRASRNMNRRTAGRPGR